ncbi:hypothetical protein SANTM175S_06069 [Streptomyces antimycoticus]
MLAPGGSFLPVASTRRRALRHDVRCGLVLARPPQDEEDQPVGIVPLRSCPATLQAGELVLGQGDPTPLSGGVGGERRDEDEGAARPQPMAQRAQGAVAEGEERSDESQGDQVIAVGVQRGSVVFLDVETEPTGSFTVVGAGFGEGGFGPVDGVHGVAG